MTAIRSPHVHATVWIITVTILMMMPATAIPGFGFKLPENIDQWIDKIQHVCAFMVMTVLLARSLREIESIHRPVLAAALLTLGISFALETLQLAIPWRFFDVLDLVADVVGVSFGVVIGKKLPELAKSSKDLASL